MHNILSYNQLAGWKESFRRLNRTLDRSMEESDVINDYYDCLIECDENQSTCKTYMSGGFKRSSCWLINKRICDILRGSYDPLFLCTDH